ncbi:MAG: DNA-directed RNA polymerase subunit omega [Acidobacteriota bacterium]
MNGHDPVFDAKDVIGNRFMLSVVTFERAKQLIRGARPRTDHRFNSPVMTALAEIAEERVLQPQSGRVEDAPPSDLTI